MSSAPSKSKSETKKPPSIDLGPALPPKEDDDERYRNLAAIRFGMYDRRGQDVVARDAATSTQVKKTNPNNTSGEEGNWALEQFRKRQKQLL